MTPKPPQERLALELPPDACRRLLARIEEMRRHGEAGQVGTMRLDRNGRVYFRLEVDLSWREASDEANRITS